MGLRSVLLAVCIVSAVKFFVGQTAGGSKMKDQLKLMLDVLLALVLITPFAQGTGSFELPQIEQWEFDTYAAQQLYDRAMTEEAARNIEDALRQQICAAGISCTDISADVNISADNCISISRVTVISDDFEAAALIVRNSLGSETEVVNGNIQETDRTSRQ